MAYNVTQSQYNVAKQSIRNVYVRIEVLNFKFFPVDSIEGKCVSGSISIDANSDIRRTCSLSFVVTDDSLKIHSGGQIFLDKYIRIYIGVVEIKSGNIIWNNMGIYLINQPTYNYDATTHTLSFEGVDLMAKLTGDRNGYISGLMDEENIHINAGSNVRNTIIDVLKLNGFNKYVVSECRNSDGTIQDVPFPMEFARGDTWHDVLSALRDILPSYQIYFDTDGVFHYEEIPYSAQDPVMIDNDIWVDNVIDEQIEVDFQSVKNAIEVWGVVHETDYYSDATVTTTSGSAINLTVDSVITKAEYQEVGFSLPQKVTGNITINVNNWGAMPLYHPNGTRVTSLEANTPWFIYYRLNGSWVFLGHAQAYGYWEDNNPNSPFYVNGVVGKIVLPLSGGGYENIQSDELALERAKYEIYKHCRLNDTLQLTTVPIYWADVNTKVSYAPQGQKEANQYMVQSIEVDLSPDGQQTWELSRFYPLYPVI